MTLVELEAKCSPCLNEELALYSVVSLRLVSPRTATDGVTYFSLRKLTLVICKVMTFFQLSSPHHSHLTTCFLQCFFLNSATKIDFIRVSPPGWCHPGRSAPAPLPGEPKKIPPYDFC